MDVRSRYKKTTFSVLSKTPRLLVTNVAHDIDVKQCLSVSCVTLRYTTVEKRIEVNSLFIQLPFNDNSPRGLHILKAS